MIKSIRRALSAFSAITTVITCLSTVSLPTILVSADEEPTNVAPAYGTGFDSYTDGLDVSASMLEDNIYYDGEANTENLNDGETENTSSACWQYAFKDENGTYDLTNVYCGIKFDLPVYATDFSVLAISAVGSGDGGGDAFVTDAYTLSYYDGSAWQDVSSSLSSDSMTVYHTFSEPTKLEAVKITFTKRYKFHPKVAEIYVVGTVDNTYKAKCTLADALVAAEALNSVIYTSDSWLTLTSAVNAANSLNLDTATEDEILAAAKAINDAIDGLELFISDALENAAQYNETYYLYNADAYTAVRNAVTYASNLVASNTTDTDALQAAADAIDAAVEAMLLTSGNLAPLGNASAESEYSNGEHPANYVNNSDNTDRWQSSTSIKDGASTWVMLDFGKATAMNQFEICWEINRAGSDNYVIQYSDDGTSWTNAQNVTISSFNEVAKPNSNDYYYYQSASFDAFEARYVRLYITGVANSSKTQPSIYEWEIYYNDLANFGAYGAQIRTNADNSSNYDLRFRSLISEEYYTTYVMDIESVGTLVARADQLKSDTLTFELAESASYTVVNLRAVYFNNAETSETGNYVFTSTILNINDIDRNYVARSYIRFSDGSVIYSDQIMRCVRNGL